MLKAKAGVKQVLSIDSPAMINRSRLIIDSINNWPIYDHDRLGP